MNDEKPNSGGSYIRQTDGSLKRSDEILASENVHESEAESAASDQGDEARNKKGKKS